VVATCRSWSPRDHLSVEVYVKAINARGKQQLKALHQVIRPRGTRRSTQCWMWPDRTSHKPRMIRHPNSRSPPSQAGRIHAPSVNRRRKCVLLRSIPKRSPSRRRKPQYLSVVDRSPVFPFTQRIRGRVLLDRSSFFILHHINESQGVIALCWSEAVADAMPVT